MHSELKNIITCTINLLKNILGIFDIKKRLVAKVQFLLTELHKASANQKSSNSLLVSSAITLQELPWN